MDDLVIHIDNGLHRPACRINDGRLYRLTPNVNSCTCRDCLNLLLQGVDHTLRYYRWPTYNVSNKGATDV